MVHRPVSRLLFLVLCALVMLRDLAWRYGSTMPSTEDPVSFVAAALLRGAETWMIAIFLLGAFMMADSLRRTAPVPGTDADLPSVDATAPTENEMFYG